MTPTEQVPASADLEQRFIGACLMLDEPATWADVQRVVDDSCFTRSLYRAAWRHIRAAWADGTMPDVVSVAHAAGADVNIDEGTALDKLMEPLSDAQCWGWTAPQRGRVLRKLATRRALIQFGTETTRNAYTEDDIEGVLAYTARVADLLDELDARDETGDVGPIADEVERLAESGDARGWPSGIDHVDRWAGGIRAGEVYLVGGPTGVGKTWMLGQIANAAVDGGRRVAFVTLEMGKGEIYTRLVAGRIGMKAFRLSGRGRTWAEDEYAEYREARAKLTSGTLRLYADQRSVAQIAAMVRATTPDVLLVDYVQLLDWPDGVRSEYEALTRSMNELQRLAKRAGCAAVLATQQSRAYQAGRGGAVPGGMGSGRIDQVADLWVLVESGNAEGELVLTCRKNRHGPTGGVATYRLDDRGRLTLVA